MIFILYIHTIYTRCSKWHIGIVLNPNSQRELGLSVFLGKDAKFSTMVRPAAYKSLQVRALGKVAPWMPNNVNNS